MSYPPPPPPPPVSKPRRNRAGVGCGIVLAGGIVLAVVVGVLLAVAPDSKDDGKDSAIDICHQLVERRLKAPSTASYSDETADGEPGRWTVYGAVDAENALGVPLRAYYKCAVRHAGGDQWKTTEPLLVGQDPYTK